ncbi:MAG TPA: hypothetical protein VGF90_01040 [Verrucomicrobiae bacterium]
MNWLAKTIGVLMPNCREALRLQSDALDRPLSRWLHAGLRFHLLLANGDGVMAGRSLFCGPQRTDARTFTLRNKNFHLKPANASSKLLKAVKIHLIDTKTTHKIGTFGT